MMREVDLLSYLPSMMKRYYEIQKIMATENPEFQLLWDADELIRQNLYIVTAQEDGLKRYEKILGVYPSLEDSLEMRRSRIITRWNDFTPYTYKYLIGLLTVLTNGHFEINTNFSEYEIEIIVYLAASGAIDDLGYIIQQIIPCNLTIVSKNEIYISAAGEMWLAVMLRQATVYFATNDMDISYNASGLLSNAFTLTQSSVMSVSNDFRSKYELAGQMNSKVTLIQTTVEQMTDLGREG